jgi:hypothetical protein
MIDGRIGHGAPAVIRGAFPYREKPWETMLKGQPETFDHPKSALVVAEFR